jgi:hypothetical protein
VREIAWQNNRQQQTRRARGCALRVCCWRDVGRTKDAARMHDVFISFKNLERSGKPPLDLLLS